MDIERTPMYQKIQNDIKYKIVKGELKPGDKIPTEVDFMETYNVSRITVSNALRKMSEENWIYRVPGKGSYVNKNIQNLILEFAEEQNASMRQLSAKPIKDDNNKVIIGIVVPFITDSYTTNYLNGIMWELGSDDYSVIIKVSQKDYNEKYCVNELLNLGVSGMIIFPFDRETYNEQLLAMKLNNFPFVLIDRYLPGIETNYVVTDNYKGGRLATSHLIELGHTKISICTGVIKPIRTQSIEERIQGYYDELLEHGIMINPDFLVTELNLDYDNFTGFEANRKIIELAKSKQITSIIALSSGYTQYIYALLRSVGIRVPEDISIVSFDNPMPNTRDLEFFTHIDQQEFNQGAEAAKILKEMLNHLLATNEYRKKVHTPRLVVRKSTARIN